MRAVVQRFILFGVLGGGVREGGMEGVRRKEAPLGVVAKFSCDCKTTGGANAEWTVTYEVLECLFLLPLWQLHDSFQVWNLPKWVERKRERVCVCVSVCVCVCVCVCVSELQKHTNTHALSLCVLALTSALR